MVQCMNLRVEKEDLDLLMNECIEEFLKHHPEFKGMRLTHRFMFKTVVKHYLREGIFFS